MVELLTPLFLIPGLSNSSGNLSVRLLPISSISLLSVGREVSIANFSSMYKGAGGAGTCKILLATE